MERRRNELLRAAANPNFAEAHHILYIYYGATGNTQEAVKQILLAKKLDPLSILIADDTGWAHYVNRDYPRALTETKKVLEMDPNYESALFQLAFIYIAMKDYQKAIEAAEKAVAVSNRGAYDLATLGYAFGRAGKTKEAQDILSELKTRSETSYVSPYHFGLIHVGLGQKEILQDSGVTLLAMRSKWTCVQRAWQGVVRPPRPIPLRTSDSKP